MVDILQRFSSSTRVKVFEVLMTRIWTIAAAVLVAGAVAQGIIPPENGQQKVVQASNETTVVSPAVTHRNSFAEPGGLLLLGAGLALAASRLRRQRTQAN